MKLLFCPECRDVRKLMMDTDTHDGPTYCECEMSWGYYEADGLNAVYGGMALLLGFANDSFLDALRKQKERGDPVDGSGWRFTAFIIPESADTVRKQEEE